MRIGLIASLFLFVANAFASGAFESTSSGAISWTPASIGKKDNFFTRVNARKIHSAKGSKSSKGKKSSKGTKGSKTSKSGSTLDSPDSSDSSTADGSESASTEPISTGMKSNGFC